MTADASTTDILHAALEGSLASGQDEFFVSNGVVRVAGTNAKTTAAYADIQRDIDYDNDGEVDKASNKALILTGSNYLDFMSPATWYMRDFTLEFFAKITGEGNDAQLVRLAPSSSPGNPSRWTLSPTGTISIYCSTNGAYHSPESKTAAADPALFRELRGGEALEKDELRVFLARYEAVLLASGIGEHYTLGRLKELWFYIGALFPADARGLKRLRKAQDLAEYRSAAERLFVGQGFQRGAHFVG